VHAPSPFGGRRVDRDDAYGLACSFRVGRAGGASFLPPPRRRRRWPGRQWSAPGLSQLPKDPLPPYQLPPHVPPSSPVAVSPSLNSPQRHPTPSRHGLPDLPALSPPSFLLTYPNAPSSRSAAVALRRVGPSCLLQRDRLLSRPACACRPLAGRQGPQTASAPLSRGQGLRHHHQSNTTARAAASCPGRSSVADQACRPPCLGTGGLYP